MPESYTEAIADFVVQTRVVPEAALLQVRRIFIDTIGVALLGSREPLAGMLRVFALEEGARPRSLMIGSSQSTSPALAALVNGATAHALDYDDVSTGLGHPSTMLVPAILAVAEDIGASGRQALHAYAVGHEVGTRIGRVVGSSNHYVRGWHSTSTIGAVYVAAAIAHLLGLTRTQTLYALGLGASHACGLRKNFGTMTKPYHAGHAAWAGVVAARLARAGYTANPTLLDSPLSYIDVMTEGNYNRALLEGLDQGDHFTLAEQGVSVKKYPCCYGTHRAADAALAVAAAEALDPTSIAEIEVEMGRQEGTPLIYDKPQTGLQGKFSLQYVVAAGVVDRTLRVRTFTDAMVQRPEIQELLPRVTKKLVEGRAPALKVAVRTTDGRRIERTCTEPRGSGSTPLSDQEIEDKFRDCAGELMAASDAEAVLQLLQALEGVSTVRDVTQLLARGVTRKEAPAAAAHDH